MASLRCRVCSLTVFLILLASLPAVAASDTNSIPAGYNGTDSWTLVSKPTMASLGGVLMVRYTNHLNITVQGVVFMDIRNTNRQTVGIVTATLSNVTAGSMSSTAYLPIWFGISRGFNYTATIFVTTAAGIVLSNSTTITYFW